MCSVYHSVRSRNQQRPPVEKQLLCDWDSSHFTSALKKKKRKSCLKLILCFWSFEPRCGQASRGRLGNEDVKTSISIHAQVAAALPSCRFGNQPQQIDSRRRHVSGNLTLPSQAFHMYLFKVLQILCLQVRKIRVKKEKKS